MIRKAYVCWAALAGSSVAAADLILQTDRRGRYQRSALRYRADYLANSMAARLHPSSLCSARNRAR